MDIGAAATGRLSSFSGRGREGWSDWTAWNALRTGTAASAEPLVNNYIVQAGTMLINFITEFLYQKFVVYRNSIDTNQLAKQKEEKGKER